MRHFTPNTYIAADARMFNEALNYCKKYRYFIYHEKPVNQTCGLRAYLVEKEVEIQLTYRRRQRVQTLVFRKDGGKFTQRSGMKAWTILNRYYKVPRAKFPTGNAQHSSSGYLYFNAKLNNNRYPNCYGYDINSSYTAAMLNDMPDTSVEPDRLRKVKRGEIGFNSDFEIVGEGHFASYIYPRIESPFTEFARVWYEKKKNAKTKEEKQEAKDILNCAVGYLQRTNPVLRTAILYYANKKIMDLVDENTLYCNTDSIVSRVKRLDIEKDLGDGLGQWKMDHQGTFAYKNTSTQWNNEVPTYRGIPKNWFPENWDLLKDPIPTRECNIYMLDMDAMRIVEVQHEKA